MSSSSKITPILATALTLGFIGPAAAQGITDCQWGSAGYSWAMKTPNGTRIATGIGDDVVLYPPSKLMPGRVRPVGNFWSNSGYNWVDDFTGDGYDDIVSANGNNIQMRLQTNNFRVNECKTIIARGGEKTIEMKSHGLSGFQRDTLSISGFWGAAGYTWTGDFDGDGRADIATASGNQVRLHFYDFTGYTTPATRWLYDLDQSPAVYEREAADPRCSTIADDYGSFSSNTWTVAGGWGAADYSWAADFDGDGDADIATASGSNILVHRSKGGRSGGFESENYSVPMPWGSGSYTWAADFNGDGKADIASASGGTMSVAIAQPVGQKGVLSGFVVDRQTINNWWGDGAYTFAEDFTGDKKADIATARSCDVKMSPSTGSGFSAPVDWNFVLKAKSGGTTGVGKTPPTSCGMGVVLGFCK
ncbi:MAG: FG-GAP repeat domain-containing protein [Henriciella sp.]